VVDDVASVPGSARRGDYLPGNDGCRRISHFHDNNHANTPAQFAGFAQIDEISLYEYRVDV
jgi:hypothetical protein